MTETPAKSTVLGLESDKYVKISYILVLVASGLGLLNSLMVAMFGGWGALPGGALIGLAGLIGWLMAVIGWFGFKESFSAVNVSHLKYITLLFLAFFVLGMILNGLFFNLGFLWILVFLVFGILQLAMVYAGFSLHRGSREVTQDTVKGELMAMKDKVTKSQKV